MPRLLLTVLACLAGACASNPPPLEGPLKVLLLGDSISIGYTPIVQEALAGRATVLRPMRPDGRQPENCGGTNNGVLKLDDWLVLDGGGWDVIHFNFGLHDLKRVDPVTGQNSADPKDPPQADPERYERQLREITKRLRATGARLVFATTTPIPPGAKGPFRAPRDAVDYNRIARAVMDDAGVTVNDLYAFALPRLAELQKPNDVHFTAAGSRALGEEVVLAILVEAGLAPSDTESEQNPTPIGRR